MELKDFFLTIIIFLFNPFIGVLISIYKVICKKENKKYLILIAIYYGFFGLIYLSSLTGDIRYHYGVFKHIFKQNNKEFIKFLSYEKDYLIFIYYKILSNFTSNPRWIGFFSAILSYGIPYYLIVDFGHKNKLKKYEILIFILLFLGVTPSYRFSGMRNYNAICLFSLAVYTIDVLKNKRGYVYIILSPLLHISMLVPVLIYFLSKYIKLNKLKVIYSLIFSIILIKFSKIILLKTLILFPEFSRYMIIYIEGEHAIKVAASWIVVLISYIFFFGVYILFYFKILQKNNLKGLGFFKFLICYFSIISIFSFSDTMYNRYSENIIPLLIVSMIYIYVAYFKKNKILLISIFIFSLLSYIALSMIEVSRWNPKIMYSSIIGLLNEGERLNKMEYIKLKR